MQFEHLLMHTSFLPILVIVTGAKKDLHPPNLCFLHFYRLAFSTRCLVLPNILGNKQLLSGLERILAFPEEVLRVCLIPCIPLACLKYQEWDL